jgi:penicillin-binding protein 1A
MTRESKSNSANAPKRRKKRGTTAQGRPEGKNAADKSASRKGAGTSGRPAERGAESKRGASSRRRRSLWGRLIVWGLVLAIWAGLAGVGVLVYYAHDLPDVDRIAAETRKPSVTLLARDGSVLASYGELYGESVSIAEVPPALSQAVMAVEDRRFYSHFGVDPLGLARALYVNLRAGHIVQGGSTITQQLAKNLFLTPDRTIKRKVQEVILAFWLEHKFTKDQILALYLNRVYLGAGTYGVDAASRRYFGKPAEGLNLYESAMLAGLLKAPSRYNPASDPRAAHERAVIVLNDMVAAGYITRAEARAAARNRARGETVTAWRGRYFADWVLRQVRGYVGHAGRDLVVETTLDRRVQRLAEREVSGVLRREGRGKNVGQAASVVLSPDGAVRAMVGGRDYRQSQFNRAAQARRQPGSAFKPFVYLAAMEAGMTPDRTVIDEPVTVGDWSPENYAGRYYGEVTLREAFARSLNSVAVKLIREVGVETVARTARRLGIGADLTDDPSLALGTSEVSLLDLAGAYAVIANGGHGVFPFGVREIRTSDGAVLYRRQGGGPGRVVEPRHIARLTDVMRANVVWGTGKRAKPGRPAAGKTGTTQNSRDAWFVGFTAGLIAGVWMGNDDGAPMRDVTGGTLPAEAWRRTVAAISQGTPAKPLPGLNVRVAESRTAPEPSDEMGAAGETGTSGTGNGGSVIDRIIESLRRDEPAQKPLYEHDQPDGR